MHVSEAEERSPGLRRGMGAERDEWGFWQNSCPL